jgi:hypothetical protein
MLLVDTRCDFILRVNRESYFIEKEKKGIEVDESRFYKTLLTLTARFFKALAVDNGETSFVVLHFGDALILEGREGS